MIGIMVDLETMGLPPNGSIVSIGACAIDFDKRDIIGMYSRNINLQTCLDNGMDVTGSTIYWWLEQDEPARTKLTSSQIGVKQALLEFTDFLRAFSITDDNLIFGNGAHFDVSLLENAYNKCKLPVPWKFWNVRCYRTIKSLFPDIKISQFAGTKHSALDDAKYQSDHLLQIIEAKNLIIK